MTPDLKALKRMSKEDYAELTALSEDDVLVEDFECDGDFDEDEEDY
jgi:hypothetical protein